MYISKCIITKSRPETKSRPKTKSVYHFDLNYIIN